MEEYYQCPDYGNQLHYAKGWFGYDGNGGSCEYYNNCNSKGNMSVGIPKNMAGFQDARTGNAYQGFLMYSTIVTSNEFSMTKFKKELKNEKYIISFYSSLANRFGLGIKEIGIYCSKDSISLSQLFADTINPNYVNNDSIITDTLNWTRVEGIFSANGGEEYLTIGNFFINRPVTSKIIDPNALVAYYYIDDVALYPINAPIAKAQCANDTLVCKGNAVSVGKTQIEQQYKAEYKHVWYISGNNFDTLSTEQFPVFYPDTTTTYVLKLTDFKYDVTYDSVRVEVVDCKQPTSLKVYPNPTNDVVYFGFDSPIPKALHIELFNILGQKIESLDYLQDYQDNTVQLNLSTLTPGLYFYRVLIEGNVKFVGKIIRI